MIPGGMMRCALRSPLRLLYKNTVASGASGITGTVYRRQDRAGGGTFTLPLTGTDVFTRKAVGLPLAAMAPGEVLEIKLAGGALAAERIFELSGVEVPVLTLDSKT